MSIKKVIKGSYYKEYWILESAEKFSRNFLHREDGPAVTLSCGSTEWFYKGVRHRIGGPAIESPSMGEIRCPVCIGHGVKYFYLNGLYYANVSRYWRDCHKNYGWGKIVLFED